MIFEIGAKQAMKGQEEEGLGQQDFRAEERIVQSLRQEGAMFVIVKINLSSIEYIFNSQRKHYIIKWDYDLLD